MNNLIKLTKKLVSIPSWVDNKTNEYEIGEFIIKYLEKNLPWLEIEKQNVEEKRFNIIVGNRINPKIVFLAHMDTVLPSRNKTESVRPKMKNGKLYGLGSADMKSGLAAMLIATEEIRKSNDICLIFDCDEEYYFKGGEKLKELNIKPNLLVCPEPTNMKLLNGCRGIYEIEFKVIGKTAHAGRPELGVNAIETTVDIVNKLKVLLKQDDNVELGDTTVNLAYLKGGREKDGEVVIQPNSVSDIAKVVLDIRSANPNLNKLKLKESIRILTKEVNAQIRDYKTNIAYKSWLTGKKALMGIDKVMTVYGIEYKKDLSKAGFYESAILTNIWNCKSIVIGPTGEGHTKDECVEIESVEKCKNFYKELICKILSK